MGSIIYIIKGEVVVVGGDGHRRRRRDRTISTVVRPRRRGRVQRAHTGADIAPRSEAPARPLPRLTDRRSAPLTAPW